MNVGIDIAIANRHPKVAKNLFDSLSDRRHNVHFIASSIVNQPNKDMRDEWISANREVLTSENRSRLDKLGVYCVGFVGVVFGETPEEIDLQQAAYCLNNRMDVFLGSEGACKAVKAALPEALVLSVAECA
jgi:hypothetical protein